MRAEGRQTPHVISPDCGNSTVVRERLTSVRRTSVGHDPRSAQQGRLCVARSPRSGARADRVDNWVTWWLQLKVSENGRLKTRVIEQLLAGEADDADTEAGEAGAVGANNRTFSFYDATGPHATKKFLRTVTQTLTDIGFEVKQDEMQFPRWDASNYSLVQARVLSLGRDPPPSGRLAGVSIPLRHRGTA